LAERKKIRKKSKKVLRFRKKHHTFAAALKQRLRGENQRDLHLEKHNKKLFFKIEFRYKNDVLAERKKIKKKSKKKFCSLKKALYICSRFERD